MLFPWVFLHGEQHEHGEEFHTWATKKKKETIKYFPLYGVFNKGIRISSWFMA